jgi:hypothetical protein
MADIFTALPALIAAYPEPLRNEAERLVEDQAVVTLDLDDGALDAEVILDDKPVHTRWSKQEEGWISESDAEDDLHDLACLMALISLRRDHEAHPVQSEAEAPVLSFQAMIERELGRKLEPTEEGYLAKVEKRWDVVSKTGEIYDKDMVRLHPRWSLASTDPLELWSDRPATALEFWNYVALAMKEKNLPYPAFLKVITDLKKTQALLARWKQARSVPQWQERVRRFSLAKPARLFGFHVDALRLLVTTTDAKLQWRGSAEEEYQTISAEQLEAIKSDHTRGALPLSVEDELLLVGVLKHLQHSDVEVFRLENERHGMWLGSLLAQPALASRLVSLDEVPLVRSEERLVWQAEDAEDAVVVKLVLPDGSAPPSPLRVLPGAQTHYLTGDIIYAGPLWFGDETLAESRVHIPAEALTSSDGVAFLDRLGAELPPSIASKIRKEKLLVEISAASNAAPSGGTQYAHLRVQARTEDGRYIEALQGEDWVIEKNAPVLDSAIVCMDRTDLEGVPEKMKELKATWDSGLDAFRTRVTKNFPENFYRWTQELAPTVTFNTDENLGSILADPLIARLRLEATQTATIDWFDLRVVLDVEGVDLTPADIRRLISAKGGFVRLADGSWRRVKIELSEEQSDLVDQLGIDLNDLNDETHRLHWRHLVGDKGQALITAQQWDSLQMRMESVKLDEKPDVPTNMTYSLRPYQVEGFHYLAYLAVNGFGGILADDMGLGKTVQTITWVLWLRARQPEEKRAPIVVVCPKSVLDVWALEFHKAAPSIRVQVLHDKDELDIRRVGPEFDVLVLNYAQLRSCITALTSIHWLAAILDEGQHIKNPDSKASRAARELKAHHRLVLTGTPLENRLLDLWSLMSFATPGALGDRSYFHKNFDRRKDERASSRLSARLRPFILRRTKSQVARDLPPRTEENLLIELSGAQEALYKEELGRAQQMVLSASGKNALEKRRFAILQALTRLRQVCCHPSLLSRDPEDPTVQIDVAAEEESGKLTAALDLIEQLHMAGQKVLFFSQFVSMLKIVRERLDGMGLPYHWLTGSSDNRADIVRRFQEDEQASVFLISLKAGGSGLNLTSASYVILYDPWWNPAVENQAIDRAHRIGQTQPVIAYRLIAKSTIEEKILMLQQKKQKMTSDILGDEGFAQSLDHTDFEFLLGLESSAKIEEEE